MASPRPPSAIRSRELAAGTDAPPPSVTATPARNGSNGRSGAVAVDVGGPLSTKEGTRGHTEHGRGRRGAPGHAPRSVRKNGWLNQRFGFFASSVTDGSEGHYGDQAQ